MTAGTHGALPYVVARWLLDSIALAINERFLHFGRNDSGRIAAGIDDGIGKGADTGVCGYLWIGWSSH